MNEVVPSVAEQVATIAGRFQEQRTGHRSTAVNVVIGDDVLVVTYQDALSPAEKDLARSASGAAQVQEFHRKLFASSNADLRKEILRITGREVREAGAEVETGSGTVTHAFKTGAMVQVFLLNPGMPTTR